MDKDGTRSWLWEPGLLALEAEPYRRKARKIVLNALENVVQFCVRHGCAVIGSVRTLFWCYSPPPNGNFGLRKLGEAPKMCDARSESHILLLLRDCSRESKTPTLRSRWLGTQRRRTACLESDSSCG